MADDVIEKPNSTETFIDKLASDDNAGAGEAFKDAMRDKVGDALDTGRKEYASNLFNAARDVMTGQTPSDGATEVAVDTAQPHSDPKPEIAEPFTAQATQDEVQNAMTPETSTETEVKTGE